MGKEDAFALEVATLRERAHASNYTSAGPSPAPKLFEGNSPEPRKAAKG